MGETLLEIRNLKTFFDVRGAVLKAVDDVDLHIEAGQTLGLVGESGCGKSVTALSIMRLLPRPSGSIEGGRVMLENVDLLSLDPEDLYKIRGKRIAMIFQEPMTALNPVHRIGKQFQIFL